MLGALNNVIISFCSIKWADSEPLKIFNEKIFLASVLLALPDEVFEKGKDCISPVRKLLLENFVKQKDGNIEILGHDKWDSEIEINEIPIAVCVLLEDKEWNDSGERENFIKSMLVYPLLSRLYEIYGEDFMESMEIPEEHSGGEGPTEWIMTEEERKFPDYETCIKAMVPDIDRSKFIRYKEAMEKGYYVNRWRRR